MRLLLCPCSLSPSHTPDQHDAIVLTHEEPFERFDKAGEEEDGMVTFTIVHPK